jgi:L-cysteine S-thiosulfotransferase
MTPGLSARMVNKAAAALTMGVRLAMVLPLVLGVVLAMVLNPTAWAQAPKKSGYDTMSPQLQAMQNDEANNPGMLWVRQGQSLWHNTQGVSQW